jgi:hypothetical protein
VSIRKVIRKDLRNAGIMVRTVKFSVLNSLTGISETKTAWHRLSATGFTVDDGKIRSIRTAKASKPGAGWRAQLRREGGGKSARRNLLNVRKLRKAAAWGLRFEAGGAF